MKYNLLKIRIKYSHKSLWMHSSYLHDCNGSRIKKIRLRMVEIVDCPKITEDKSSESRDQTPDAELTIATNAAPRHEGRNPRLSITAVAVSYTHLTLPTIYSV